MDGGAFLLEGICEALQINAFDIITRFVRPEKEHLRR